MCVYIYIYIYLYTHEYLKYYAKLDIDTSPRNFSSVSVSLQADIPLIFDFVARFRLACYISFDSPCTVQVQIKRCLFRFYSPGGQ